MQRYALIFLATIRNCGDAYFVSVKETVTDIADVLKSMNEKLGSMQKTIDSQHDTICNLNRNINKLMPTLPEN